jgi:hypothetical protein
LQVTNLDVAHPPGRQPPGLGANADVAGDGHRVIPDRSGPTAGKAREQNSQLV